MTTPEGTCFCSFNNVLKLGLQAVCRRLALHDRLQQTSIQQVFSQWCLARTFHIFQVRVQCLRNQLTPPFVVRRDDFWPFFVMRKRFTLSLRMCDSLSGSGKNASRMHVGCHIGLLCFVRDSWLRRSSLCMICLGRIPSPQPCECATIHGGREHRTRHSKKPIGSSADASLT